MLFKCPYFTTRCAVDWPFQKSNRSQVCPSCSFDLKTPTRDVTNWMITPARQRLVNVTPGGKEGAICKISPGKMGSPFSGEANGGRLDRRSHPRRGCSREREEPLVGEHQVEKSNNKNGGREAATERRRGRRWRRKPE